jgi:hypothetical protein
LIISVIASGRLKRLASGVGGSLIVLGNYFFLKFYLPPLGELASSLFSITGYQAFVAVIYIGSLILGLERIYYAISGKDNLFNILFGSDTPFSWMRYVYSVVLLGVGISLLASSAFAYTLSSLSAGAGLIIMGLNIWYS